MNWNSQKSPAPPGSELRGDTQGAEKDSKLVTFGRR